MVRSTAGLSRVTGDCSNRKVCAMGGKRWSAEHIEYLISNYPNLNIPLIQILNHLGRNQPAVSKVANQLGLFRDGGVAKHKSFSNPFLVSDFSAMWVLGLWYTDGHVTSRAAMITQKDREILDKAKSIISPSDQPDRVKIFPFSGKTKAWVLQVSSIDMVKYLSECGIEKRKSRTMKFPSWIPFESLSHFARGLWDGDGYIGLDKKNSPIATYACGSEEFIKSFSTLIGSITGVNPTVHKQNSKECYTITVAGKKAKVFLEWVYSGSEDRNRLHRKHLKYSQSCTV